MQRNDILHQYLEFLIGAKNTDDLAFLTGKFLNTICSLNEMLIIRHTPGPKPFSLIFPADEPLLYKEWKTKFERFDHPVKPYQIIEADGYNYCFPDVRYSENTGEFLVSRNRFPEHVVNVVQLWDLIRKQLLIIVKNNSMVMQHDFAAQNSQLMHDIQAIIDLHGKTENDTPLARRIVYQEKANRNFLFWVRPIDLFPASVPVKDLIFASLELINIKKDMLLIQFPKSNPEVTVDVELFSRAFNEILLNGVMASENDLSKIEIEITIAESVSPLLKNKWIKFQIRDIGPGIPDDFMPFIWNPFFTTHKQEGHTGFGLPIAKKIINAHRGTVEIKSAQGMGTIVKIYLPF